MLDETTTYQTTPQPAADKTLPKRGRGKRKLTPEAHNWRSKADSFRGLGEATSHNQLQALLHRAAPQIGLSREDLDLLDYLFSKTRPQDWKEGSRPIAFPSNGRIAHDLDLTVRGAQRRIANLVRNGWVVMRDSPDGKRHGRHDQRGKVKAINPDCSFGFDLSVIAMREPELTEAAAAHAKIHADRRAYGRRARIARDKIASVIATVDDHATWSPYWEQTESAAKAHATALLDKDITAAEITELAGKLETLAADAEAMLLSTFAATLKSVESSPEGEAQFTQNTPTIPPISSRTVQSGSAEKCSQAEPPVSKPHHETAGFKLEYEPSNPDKKAQAVAINPAQIVAAAPQLAAMLQGAQPTWPALEFAAQSLMPHLGMKTYVWGRAVAAFGSKEAAIAVFARMLAFPLSHFTTSRAAWFGQAIKDAGTGKFNSSKCGWGLIISAGKLDPEEALREIGMTHEDVKARTVAKSSLAATNARREAELAARWKTTRQKPTGGDRYGSQTRTLAGVFSAVMDGLKPAMTAADPHTDDTECPCNR